jgi:hypothetical protein
MPITDDQWFGAGGGGGGVSNPLGPIGHANAVLNSSSGGTTSPAATNHLRTLARTLSARRQRRRTNYRIQW